MLGWHLCLLTPLKADELWAVICLAFFLDLVMQEGTPSCPSSPELLKAAFNLLLLGSGLDRSPSSDSSSFEKR